MIEDINTVLRTLRKIRTQVSRIENSPITRMPERIRKYYIAHEDKGEIPWVRIKDILEMNLPRPIVLVNGAFDVLHSGHMKIIFQARQRAKTLVVAMDSDERVGRKGPGRPIQSWVERATTMNYMPVDYLVEIETDKDMEVLIDMLEPDLQVQGWDYKDVDSKFPEIPKCLVRNSAMRTSKIIERCKKVG